MKAIVVEGLFDHIVIGTLFPKIKERNIMLREALGFSNVFAVSKTLIDFGYDVLMVLDTDSNVAGHDNRLTIERIMGNRNIGGKIEIVWMDPFIELVLDKVVPGIWKMKKNHSQGVMRAIYSNRDKILQLDEFKQIARFIDKE